MLVLNERNDILGWKDRGGVDIFFPQQRIGEKLRGGAFPCIPQFGSVPTTKPSWSDIKLPRHGLWRLQNPEVVIDTYTSSDACECQTRSYKQPEGYPFHFFAEERFQLLHEDDATTILYGVTVLRSPDCQNEKLMPWMPGWHPYFATHGEPFKAWVGRSVPMTEDTPLDPAAIYDFYKQPVKLQTKHHHIEFVFDNTEKVVVWSDKKSQYVCIEPVSSEFLLKRGGHASMFCRIRVEPRN